MTKEEDSCAEGISRKDFIKVIVERGTVAGSLLFAASSFNVFTAAPALAQLGPSGLTGLTGTTGATGFIEDYYRY